MTTHTKYTKQDEERRSRKLFIGGVSFSTTDEDFFQYFAKYGELEDCVLIREKNTGESRGFGFVTYTDKAVSEHVAKQQLYLDGRRLDPKPSISRFSMDKIHGSVPHESKHRNQTTKVFVGGLHDDTAEAELSEHFKTFGEVLEINIMYDRFTNAPRGFGFVTFKEHDIAEKVINWDQQHIIHGKNVDCKPATARKDAHNSRDKKPTSREERWRKYHGDNEIDDYKRHSGSGSGSGSGSSGSASHMSHSGHNVPAPHVDPYGHSSYAHHTAYSHSGYGHPPHSSYAHSSYPPPHSAYGYGTGSTHSAPVHSYPPPPPHYGHGQPPHYDPYYRHYPPPPPTHGQPPTPVTGTEYKYAPAPAYPPPPTGTHQPPPQGQVQPRYDYYAQYPPPQVQPQVQSQVQPQTGVTVTPQGQGQIKVKKDDKSGLPAPVKPIGNVSNVVGVPTQDVTNVQSSYGPARGSKAINSAQGARYSAY